MSAEMIKTVTSASGSAFHKFLGTLKASDMSGQMGELIGRWQNDYIHEELSFWIPIWEREVANDPEGAEEEDPPRQEAIEAARTLLRFFNKL